jgi:regulator of protease activity HflC (stomatin/prohibitin superfamily)
VAFIDAGEQGLLERFGKPVPNRTLLEPGAHLKWPWPIETVFRFRTEQIQSFNVGFTSDPDKEREKIVLWTAAHTKEENFLVANRAQTSTEGTNQVTAKRTPPVSHHTVSISRSVVQITNVLSWAYGKMGCA